jgi:hypothetical protein
MGKNLQCDCAVQSAIHSSARGVVYWRVAWTARCLGAWTISPPRRNEFVCPQRAPPRASNACIRETQLCRDRRASYRASEKVPGTNAASLGGNRYWLYGYVGAYGLFIKLLTIEQKLISAKSVRFKCVFTLLNISICGIATASDESQFT